MGRAQWSIIALAIVTIPVMYFLLPTKPAHFRTVEQIRAASSQSTDINALLAGARPSLDQQASNQATALEKELVLKPDDIAVLKDLSGFWFQQGNGPIAGYYAAQVAEIEGTADAWSIAGTTYLMSLDKTDSEHNRQFVVDGAKAAFEKAITIAPDDVQHRINLSLLYTEAPPADQPMKGILMLVDLNKTHPDNPAVLFHLGRLALRTGQLDKAIERLEGAVALRPDHLESWVLLETAYRQQGQTSKANAARKKTEELN